MTSPVEDRVLQALLGTARQSWEQGVASHALLDRGRLDLVRVLARDALTRQTPAGKLGEIDDYGTVNCAANGEAVAWLAEAGGDDRAGKGLQRQLDWLLRDCPRADDGTLFHIEGEQQVWVDSVYMVVPLLVRCGLSDEARRQLDGHRTRLRDDSGLWAHQWDEARGEAVRDVHWGSGNGWVAAGLARSARHADDASAFGAEARELIDVLLPHRAASGLFHDVVDDPTTFEECTLALMLAYAAAVGAADGWLEPGYADTARDLVQTVTEHVDEDGFVVPACGSPRFDRPGTSAEAQSFFLLATRALQDA